MQESVDRTRVYERLLKGVLDKLASGPKEASERQELREEGEIFLRLLIETLPTAERGPYAEIKAPTLAAMDHLKKVGRPIPREELVEAVYAGGFRRGRDTRSNIRKAIGRFVDERKGKLGAWTRDLREYNGKVGIGKWPSEMWENNGTH